MVAAAALVMALALAPGAQAGGFKLGPVTYTNTSTCFGAKVTPAYSQTVQDVEPKVGEVTYLTLRVTMLQTSFSCAADFFRLKVTVPAGVAPTGGAPICSRFQLGGQGQVLYSDTRIATNCPASVSFNPTTRQFDLNPKSSPVYPDQDNGALGTRWFYGFDSAANQQKNYYDVMLKVPVKATQTMTNQPVSYQVCTIGTSCATATVNMTINPAPPPPDTTPPGRPGPLTGTPSGPTRNPAAAIGFTLAESGGTVRCRLDSGSWVACTSVSGRSGTFRVSGLADGVHTVSIRQTDGAGNTSPVATSAAWRVDRAAPSASLSVQGTPRRGRLVTLRVAASDPSGIRRVTIKVGSASPHVGSAFTVRMPSRGRSVAVVVTVTDRAGNTRTLSRALALRP